MPADLFWAMNGCIDRINAEKDLRGIAVSQASVSQEAAKKTTERLVMSRGDVFRMGGYYVEPEAGVSSKFRALMRK